MKDKTIFITGANGEIGNLLLPTLKQFEPAKIITLDLNALSSGLDKLTDEHFTGSVSDEILISRVFDEGVDIVIHLAAKLSTSSELDPSAAFETNIVGVNNLFSAAANHGGVKLFFPSSIAVYGLPDLQTKNNEKVDEAHYTDPITLYGVHKQFAEMLGKYYKSKGKLDFRCIRFPGLLSADTLPTGGTSDWGPELVHSFADHTNYKCFVRKDSYLPFMAMPDAVDAVLQLIEAPKNNLKSSIYNITSFSVSPYEIIELCEKHFQKIEIDFEIDEMRQNIVDSWPKDIDDSAAREEWGYSPKYDFESAFQNYIFPSIH